MIAPVAVGGVGGSGTRLVAQLLRALGYRLGADLNEADDNLWFTLLFKRADLVPPEQRDADVEIATRAFLAVMADRSLAQPELREYVFGLARRPRVLHSAPWLRERAVSFVAALDSAASPGPWGWKEPNTHIFVDQLHQRIHGLRYVHVMRDGLDMAVSRNQFQLAQWGPWLLGNEFSMSPRSALKYWCRANRRALATVSAMGERGLVVHFDALCLSPRHEIAKLLRFLGVEATARRLDALVPLVTPPASRGRHGCVDCGGLDPDDVSFAESLRP